MFASFWTKNKSVFLYGASLALFLFFLKWVQLKFIIFNHALEIYSFVIALTFTALGVWLAVKLTNPRVKTIVVEKEIFTEASTSFAINTDEIKKLGLSQRELEVLNLMAQGMSNQEIAQQLFVSLNTIKTHSSKIFEKLEVNRRTQAVEKAKRLKIIA
ncbi:MAG: DNA-binding response regulator [Saprospiraceae bacterium]|nr:DNA-binding response regulator [Saprospiraceae bacterium]